MKWAKSRNAKNVRSSSGSLGTDSRVALGQLADDAGGGRADVVDVQLGLGQAGDERLQTHPSESVRASARAPNPRAQPIASTMPSSGLAASSPSTNTVGVPFTPLRDIASVAFSIHCNVGAVLDQRPDLRLLGAGLDGEVDELVVGVAGPPSGVCSANSVRCRASKTSGPETSYAATRALAARDE